MSPRYLRSALLVGIAWIASGPGGAHAAVIVQTVPFTITAPNASNLGSQIVNVSTPQFNPALGTFESGTTTISGTLDIALEFFTTGTGGPYDAVLTDTLSLDGIPGRFDQELTGTLPPNQPAFITPAAAFPFGPVERGDPAVLVVGATAWNQVYSLPLPSLTVRQGPPNILAGIMISGTSVTTYTFTPAVAPVPEPASGPIVTAVLGCTLVALGWRKRKRHAPDLPTSETPYR